MKVTIWQQFNSNHSSSFTVVGHFATEEKAQQAEEALRQLFTEVASQRRAIMLRQMQLESQGYEYEDIRRTLAHEFEYPDGPTAAERAFMQQHQIDWAEWEEDGIDWLSNLDRHLNRLGHYIVIETGGADTWQEPPHIMSALNALGAQQTYANDLTVLITCIAPDERRAVAITQTVNSVIKAFGTPPQHGETFFARQERIERLIDWVPVQATSEQNPAFTYGIYRGQPATYTRRQPSASGDELTGYDVRIAVEFVTLPLGLPAMLQWLRMLDCQQIQYVFKAQTG